MKYDKKRVFRDAHKQWRAVSGRPGWDFARCLKLAWAVEKKRAAGPEYYQPDNRTPSAFQPRITAAHVISASGGAQRLSEAGRSRDWIWL